MLVALLIIVIVVIICATMLIGCHMDNKRMIEKEKLSILKSNPDLFVSLFGKDKNQK